MWRGLKEINEQPEIRDQRSKINGPLRCTPPTMVAPGGEVAVRKKTRATRERRMEERDIQERRRRE
uniref:Uncharacterized protein n=1 Tax=Pristionchus pacificus TaxID=54126 RepID=A0A2A6BGN5_PRIPA|eukprot:PDM65052.1 hypothetical protein PRIPAC_53301 [Pristionchus pacificus]